MIPRDLAERARRDRSSYPALLVTGPRQSGKTTFVRETCPDLPFVNLESPLERAEFRLDPLGFFARFPDGAIIDEAQNERQIFSYLQVVIDRDRRMGRWVLTGSQQLSLVEGASQSLAGRQSILELFPFSHAELSGSARRAQSVDRAILQGGYPPLYDEKRSLDVSEWLENYLATFVHRDLRAVLEPRKTSSFDRFLRLCAARTGQLLNKSSLATECEVDHKTIDRWLEALEACYVVRMLRPHHRNFGKRLVKSPKLHFLDSGLACRLLHITDVQQLSSHPLRGALFETWCYTEVLKFFAHRGGKEPLWFWRSSDGAEIDVLLERGSALLPIEIKSGLTPDSQAAKGIQKLAELRGREQDVGVGRGLVIYGGTERRASSRIEFIPWNEIATALEELG